MYDLILKNKYKKAIEIGTSTGLSAIWIAWALSKTEGKLITIEIDEGRYKKALTNFREAGLTEYIDARLADAHGLLEKLTEAGFIIRSKENLLTLKIDPLNTQLSETKGTRIQSWGVSKATLHWKGRVVPGRVIHERLVHLNWNRLTRTYAGTWDNFQGFYLALDRGTPDTWRDFYWPQRWAIEVNLKGADDSAPVQLILRQVSRKNQGNWIIGGFAMTVVEGELIRNGETIPVLGFAELIK